MSIPLIPGYYNAPKDAVRAEDLLTGESHLIAKEVESYLTGSRAYLSLLEKATSSPKVNEAKVLFMIARKVVDGFLRQPRPQILDYQTGQPVLDHSSMLSTGQITIAAELFELTPDELEKALGGQVTKVLTVGQLMRLKQRRDIALSHLPEHSSLLIMAPDLRYGLLEHRGVDLAPAMPTPVTFSGEQPNHFTAAHGYFAEDLIFAASHAVARLAAGNNPNLGWQPPVQRIVNTQDAVEACLVDSAQFIPLSR